MRVSPFGFAFDNLEAVLREAKRSAEVTHNHPEGIRGAQPTATAQYTVFLNINLVPFLGIGSPLACLHQLVQVQG